MAQDPDRDPGRTKPIILEWAVDVRGTVEATWSVFSDTDRFTRAIGTKLTFDETPRDDGTVLRTGSMVSAGLRMRWREVALDFVAPRWFRTIRVFESGPIDRYRVDLELTATSEGTHAAYSVTTWPRSTLMRPIVATQLHLSAKRGIDRTIGELVAVVEGRPSRYDPAPPPLTAAAQTRLTEGLTAVRPSVAGPLRAHLNDAALPEQDHLRPKRLAQRWGLDVEETLCGLMEAVSAGLLALTFDLLCPSCFGAKARLPTLGAAAAGVHCPSCNIAFDARFPGAVGVSFRPVPQIRSLEIASWCIGSPQRMPHVVARLRAAPDETVSWTADVEPGLYRLRAQTSLAASFVDVSEDAGSDRVVAEIGAEHVAPARLQVRPGAVRFDVRSRMQSPEWLLLERRWRPPDTLTLGELLAHPDARALLGPKTVGPDLRVQLRRAAVYVAEAFAGPDAVEALQSEIIKASPARICLSANRVVAVWSEVEDPLAVAGGLDGALQITGAVGCGPVMDLDESAEDADWLPTGAAVDEAVEALRRSVPGRTSVGERSADSVPSGGPPRLVEGPRIDGTQAYLLDFEVPPAPPPTLCQPMPARSHEALEGATIARRFELIESIGEGAFGTVYAARDRRGPDVVLKVMKQKHMHRPAVFQQFFAEASALSRIDHPNVVPIRDFGHDDSGQLYIAMERLTGAPLQDRLQEGLLTPEATIEMAVGVLRGLEAAHDASLVHRDLKPANVFCGAGPIHRDQTTLLDFGLALPIEQLENLKPAQAGTFAYMSPEQLGHGAMGPSADLYSLGLMMYRCLAGDVPRGSMPTLQMVTMRIAKPAPALSTVADGVPAALEEEIMRALERDPAARRGSAAAMAAALEALSG